MEELEKNNFAYEDPAYRALCLGNFGAKTDRLMSQLENIIKSADSIETKKINQISSIIDQLSKLINDAVKEK